MDILRWCCVNGHDNLTVRGEPCAVCGSAIMAASPQSDEEKLVGRVRWHSDAYEAMQKSAADARDVFNESCRAYGKFLAEEKDLSKVKWRLPDQRVAPHGFVRIHADGVKVCDGCTIYGNAQPYRVSIMLKKPGVLEILADIRWLIQKGIRVDGLDEMVDKIRQEKIEQHNKEMRNFESRWGCRLKLAIASAFANFPYCNYKWRRAGLGTMLIGEGEIDRDMAILAPVKEYQGKLVGNDDVTFYAADHSLVFIAKDPCLMDEFIKRHKISVTP